MAENVRNEAPEPPAGAAFGWSGDPLDLVLEHWRAIGACAWEGFLTSGRGTVWLRVDEDGDLASRYQPGAPCQCHETMVQDYDPERQVVVYLLHDDGDTLQNPLLLVEGYPTPRDTVALVTAEDLGAPLH